MALSPSEIDKILNDDSFFDTDEDEGASGSESENNILAYSGSDDYKPSSSDESSDDEFCEQLKRIRRGHSANEKDSMYTSGVVGPHSAITQVLHTPGPSGSCGTKSVTTLSAESRPDSSNTYTTLATTTGSSGSASSTPQRTTTIIKGKNGYSWTENPPTISTRNAPRNIVNIRQRPKGRGKDVLTPLDAFQLFFTDTMVNLIVTHTNEEIVRKQANYKTIQFSNSQTSPTEIKALLGIMIFSALHKDNSLNTAIMFDPSVSGNVYRACFSEKRFQFLLDCLRFDDKTTRAERVATDRFAPIRDLWEAFMKSCIDNYEAGPYLTIDEQLLAFRGRSAFKMYMPKKPAKYGLKIVMVCDAGSKYMLVAEPYLGKQNTTVQGPLSQYYVKKLTAPFHGSNRNLTMDNWFTTVPLADELLKDPYKLTLLGTIRLNKPEIPLSMRSTKNRDIGDSKYLFSNTTTLLSHKAKKNKVVCLISTMHQDKGVNQDGKPVMIDHYNQTKGGVDTLDQMVSVRSCSRKTKRWQLCIFYDLIDIGGVNSLIILNRVLSSRKEQTMTRTSFLNQLYQQLVFPWLEQRLTIKNLPRELRSMVFSVLGRKEAADPVLPRVDKKRTTCKICPAEKRRMTVNYCSKCDTAFCAEHRREVCKNCSA